MDDNLKREIIIDNYQNPLNKELIDDNSYLSVNQASESCIDNLDFMMKIEDGWRSMCYKYFCYIYYD